MDPNNDPLITLKILLALLSILSLTINFGILILVKSTTSDFIRNCVISITLSNILFSLTIIIILHNLIFLNEAVIPSKFCSVSLVFKNGTYYNPTYILLIWSIIRYFCLTKKRCLPKSFSVINILCQQLFSSDIQTIKHALPF